MALLDTHEAFVAARATASVVRRLVLAIADGTRVGFLVIHDLGPLLQKGAAGVFASDQPHLSSSNNYADQRTTSFLGCAVCLLLLLHQPTVSYSPDMPMKVASRAQRRVNSAGRNESS